MTSCIVGYSGFVGGNLLLQKKFDAFYNSKNIQSLNNESYDEVYFCGIPSVKWYANKHPEEDTYNIVTIMKVLKTIKVKRFILISTIDVYERPSCMDTEDCVGDYENNHTYGKNRYFFEEFIKELFENHYIVRLPAVFGYGLKKNALYDLLHNNQINNIQINSKYQWYNLDWLCDDINKVVKNNIRVCNFFTEPLHTRKIIDLFEYPIWLYDNRNKTEYNITTKYSSLFNCKAYGYIRTKEEVEESIVNFIDYNNIKKDNLCVSNLCVNEISQLQFSCILKTLGFKNVEIAPTKLMDWENLIELDLSIFNGLKVHAFQSLTFGLNSYNIFNENSEELINHLKYVIDCASRNNVKVLVFGSPKSRYILNEFKGTENENVAIEFFKILGEYCENKNVTICIEPNSKKYDCNFINNIDEAVDFVLKVNNKNIKAMFDLGNAVMDKEPLENIILYKGLIEHVHISQEYMNNFNEPCVKNKAFVDYLYKFLEYENMITLEMLIKEDDELNSLKKSLVNFIYLYGREKNSRLNKQSLHFKKLYM
jgi:sugar phosphate isomerase/epimerase